MRVLFVHPYFPGQFKNIALHFRNSDIHEVVAFHRGLRDGREMPLIEGITMIEYGNDVQTNLPPSSPIYSTERFIREAASMAHQANNLRESGWQPDLVFSHAAWGSTAFLHDVFPRAKYVKYCEWFYNNRKESTEFLSDERDLLARIQTNIHNVPLLSEMMRADALISPTNWQKSQFPPHLAAALTIVPDGVDTEFFKPDAGAAFEVGNEKVLRAGDRVITYVARGADPFRGFEPFLEAVAALQSRDPDVQVIIVGDRKVYYGAGHGTEQHFHDVTSRIKLDSSRTHFVGRISYQSYRTLLQVSAVHVYLTVPFVLSWSALEALSTGCAVVASNTAPVKEFIEDGRNGLLADFFNVRELTETMQVALAGGGEIDRMRKEARQTIVDRWSLDEAVARYNEVIAAVGLSTDKSGGRVRLRRK